MLKKIIISVIISTIITTVVKIVITIKKIILIKKQRVNNTKALVRSGY